MKYLQQAISIRLFLGICI